MTTSFETHPYSTLTARFNEAMSKSIESNKNVPLSQFKTKELLNEHFVKIEGWQQALDAFNEISKGLENEPAPPVAQIDPNVIAPTVTEGEIVE